MDEVAIANAALSFLNQKPIALRPGETWATFRADNAPHSTVRLHFDQARREALSKRAWRFATVKEALQRSDYQPPEARWNLAYVWPANCLRFIPIVDLFAGVGDRRYIFPDARSREVITFESVEADNPLARPPAGALISPTGAGGFTAITAEAFGEFRKWDVRTAVIGGTPRKVILTNLPDGVGEYVVDVPEVVQWSPLFVTAFTWLLASKIGYTVSGKTAEAARAFSFYRAAVKDAEAQDANESNDEPRQTATWIERRRRGVR